MKCSTLHSAAHLNPYKSDALKCKKMTHNQVVPGSSPGGTTKTATICCGFFLSFGERNLFKARYNLTNYDAISISADVHLVY